IAEGWNWIKGQTLAAWNAVKGAVLSAFGEVRKFVAEVAPDVKADIKELLDWLGPTWKFDWEEVKLAVTLAWGYIKTATSVAFAVIKGAFQLGWGLIRDTTRLVWDVIKNYIKLVWDFISGNLKVGLKLLHGDWSGAWQAMQQSSVQVWDDIKRLFGDLLNDILRLVINWGQNLYNAGSGAIKAFASGIKNQASEAVGAVHNMVSNIASLMPHSDADTGPLSQLTASGRALGETFAEGIRQGTPHAVNAAREMAAAVHGAMVVTNSIGDMNRPVFSSGDSDGDGLIPGSPAWNARGAQLENERRSRASGGGSAGAAQAMSDPPGAPATAGLSFAQVTELAKRAGFVGERLKEAVSVAYGESGFDARNVGDGGTSFGLFQLHRGGILPDNWGPEQAFDPTMAAKKTFEASNGGENWKPWHAYGKPDYQRAYDYLSGPGSSLLTGDTGGAAGVQGATQSAQENINNAVVEHLNDNIPNIFLSNGKVQASCAHWASMVFRHAGAQIGHIVRASALADAMRRQSTPVSRGDAQPGDFVHLHGFGYGSPEAQTPTGGDHVGIYVGNGRYMSSSGGRVHTSPLPADAELLRYGGGGAAQNATALKDHAYAVAEHAAALRKMASDIRQGAERAVRPIEANIRAARLQLSEIHGKGHDGEKDSINRLIAALTEKRAGIMASAHDRSQTLMAEAGDAAAMAAEDRRKAAQAREAERERKTAADKAMSTASRMSDAEMHLDIARNLSNVSGTQGMLGTGAPG
ncbi:MAG: NlpC/P60 family protein, partial [Armatimonadota bacterium]|nr:NlpC/P60 family protein [Armatimonadota bacterium]